MARKWSVRTFKYLENVMSKECGMDSEVREISIREKAGKNPEDSDKKQKELAVE